MTPVNGKGQGSAALGVAAGQAGGASLLENERGLAAFGALPAGCVLTSYGHALGSCMTGCFLINADAFGPLQEAGCQHVLLVRESGTYIKTQPYPATFNQ